MCLKISKSENKMFTANYGRHLVVNDGFNSCLFFLKSKQEFLSIFIKNN